jgi:PTS system nitrogen regulatory IIA component
VDISDLITPQRVIATLQAGDKPSLLRELSERAAKQLALGSEAILDALRSRETLGSTGVGQGIALPHARIAALEHFFGLFARLERPINFDAIDDGPVDLVFLLLIPEQAGNEHLAALAAVSRRLRQREVAAQLRNARASSELYEILTGPRTTPAPIL